MEFVSFREKLLEKGISVFSIRDTARITGKPLSYCKVFLNRWEKKKRISRIERGKYCLPEADLLEVASNLVFPCYASFLTALSFHGLTTQIPFEVQIACLKQKKPVEFGNARIVFVKLKRKALFGYKRVKNAFVAEPEKAVVDALYLFERVPVAEAFYAIKQGTLNTNKLEEYAERLGSTVVKKRLGFLLERARIATKITPRLNNKMDLLSPLKPKGIKTDARWRIMVNEVFE